MNWARIRVLVGQDLSTSFDSASRLLLLSMFGVVFGTLLYQLSTGGAIVLAQQQGALLASLFFEPKVAQALFLTRSPTLSATFIFILSSAPLFAMVGAASQTSTDLKQRYIRFLLPRCTRAEIFSARLLGSVCVLWLLYLLVVLAAMVIALQVDSTPSIEIIAYGLRILLTAWVYILPFVGILALCTVLTGSSATAALIAAFIYTSLYLSIGFALWNWPTMDWLTYFLPGYLKPHLWQGELQQLLPLMVWLLVYAAIWAGCGLALYRRKAL